MSEDGLLEEDIWEYKSIRKQKPVSQHSEVIATNIQKAKVGNDKLRRNDNRNDGKTPKGKEAPKKTKQRPRKRGNQTPLKPVFSSDDPVKLSQEGLSTTSAKETKICERQNSAKARPVFEGYCPSCQMPFSLLLIETPQWHVTECLDVSGTAEKECPEGVLCSSVIPSHYKRYSHFQLAASRAQDSTSAFSLSSAENNFIRPGAASCNEFNCRVFQDMKVSQSLEKSKQSLLLPKESSKTMDSINITNTVASSLGNIKEPEHTLQYIDGTKRVECLSPFSQETGRTEKLDSQLCSFQQNTCISEADLNDSDISYSPLHTDEENAIETDEADKEALERKAAVAKITCKKNLFDTRNLESQSRTVGSLSNIPQRMEFQHKSVKMMQYGTTINEPSEILPASMDETSKPLPQKSMHSSIDSSASFLDQLKCPAGDFSLRKAEEELDWLTMNSSNFNAGDCGQGSSNDSYWLSAGSAVKDLVLSAKSEKGALQSFQLGQSEVVEKLSSLDIKGTGFVVDAFQYGKIEGCTAYFLTHFHSDHYGGLTKKFTFPIYCNKVTGNLVTNKLGVREQYVHILPMDRECIINGIKVVLLDANQYCSPEYTFPSQQEVIQFAVSTAFERVTVNPRTLVVCGTYSIGKEKVFLGIAEVLGSKASMSREKYKILQCLESATINSLITLNWNNTLLHLLPMMQINFKNLQNHLNKFSENFDHILAFKPTGWTYSDGCCSLSDIQPQTRGNITIYGIPYSEHSSFLEMKRFIQWLKPQKIVPTVNVGNWKARHEMEKHFRDWKMEVTEWN
ncbi:DNA cross-link repair 1A protein isoform 7-T8 [Liasis olivaceus]